MVSKHYKKSFCSEHCASCWSRVVVVSMGTIYVEDWQWNGCMYLIFTFSCHQHQLGIIIIASCLSIHPSITSLHQSVYPFIHCEQYCHSNSLWDSDISPKWGGMVHNSRTFFHVPWNFIIFHDKLGPDGTFGGVMHSDPPWQNFVCSDVGRLKVLSFSECLLCYWYPWAKSFVMIRPVQKPVYLLACILPIILYWYYHPQGQHINCHILTAYFMCSCQPSGRMSTANSVSIYWGITHNANEC